MALVMEHLDTSVPGQISEKPAYIIMFSLQILCRNICELTGSIKRPAENTARGKTVLGLLMFLSS